LLFVASRRRIWPSNSWRNILPGTRTDTVRIGSALLPLLLLAVVSCRTIEGTVGLPPFVEYVGDRGEFYFRPLFSTHPHEVRVVWPLFRYRKNEKGTSVWLIPILSYRARPQEGGYDRDLYIVPCIAWGDSPDEGSHFALFPIAGKLTSFLGNEEVRFVLWPIFTRIRNRGTVSHHLFYPLINWLHGGGRSGWRVWPFWAVYRGETEEGKPRYRRYYVLWPFFSYQRNNLETSVPSTAWVFFPFYSRIEGKNISRLYVMWPLFSWAEDRKRRYTAWGMPFLPIRFGSGDDEKQIDIWPLFGWWKNHPRARGKNAVLFRQYALWPIQRYEFRRTEAIKGSQFWFLPFWWRSDIRWRRDDTYRKRRKIWPFFAWERTNEKSNWEVFSLLPWFDEDVERFWGRFWCVARYRRYKDRKALEILWGLFSREESGERSGWRFAGGLLGAERHRDGSRTYRIFFIPITVEN